MYENLAPETAVQSHSTICQPEMESVTSGIAILQLIQAGIAHVTQIRRPVLMIDALDECKDYSDLVGQLVKLAEDARLRLFVTSRSEPDIQGAFNGLPTMSLKDNAAQMKNDIQVHITEQLENRKRLSRLPVAEKYNFDEIVRKG